MREKILKLLQKEFTEINFEGTKLVDDGVLDSLILVEIITTISMEFGIAVPYEEIIPENFNSIDAIAELVERLVS